jgi:hypothetical protein
VLEVKKKTPLFPDVVHFTTTTSASPFFAFPPGQRPLLPFCSMGFQSNPYPTATGVQRFVCHPVETLFLLWSDGSLTKCPVGCKMQTLENSRKNS